MDDYKLFSFYEKRGGSPKNGFSSFTEKGEYYFTYNNNNGDVIFISENYTTSTARNKGIASVTKNMKDATRFKVVKAGNKKYHLSLKAGNNKEICISRNFASESAAYDAASKVSGKKIEAPIASSTARKSSTQKATSKTASIAKVSSKSSISKTAPKVSSKSAVKKAAPKKVVTAKSKVVPAKTSSVKSKAKVTTSKVKATTATAKPALKATAKPVAKKGASVKKSTTKVASSTKATAKPVAKASVKPAVTKTTTSKPSATKVSATKPTTSNSIASGNSKGNTSSTASTVKKVAAVAAVTGLAASALGKSFDYLSVASYKGGDGFNSFQDNTTKAHYFSYNKGGKALLRSVGKKSESERNDLLDSVKTSANNSKNWKKGKTVDGKYYYFLTNNDNKEIAKSAIYENITDMTGDLTWVSSNMNKTVTSASTVAAASTATIKTNQLTHKKQDASYSASSNMNNEERERLRLQQLREQAMQNNESGGKKWLPMLLLLLIPLLLLFFVLKGCNGCSGDKVVVKKPKTTRVVPANKTTTIKDAQKIVDSKKSTLGTYSGLSFDKGTIEHTLKSCCDDSNCYDGKLYYWGEPNFSTNSAALSSASVASIENVARLMKSYRGMSLTIAGNSSTNEDEGSAGGLSSARAKAMRDVLVNNGVDANKVNYSGNGNGNTINYNGDSKADYQNRRLDIIINSCKAAGGVK